MFTLEIDAGSVYIHRHDLFCLFKPFWVCVPLYSQNPDFCLPRASFWLVFFFRICVAFFLNCELRGSWWHVFKQCLIIWHISYLDSMFVSWYINFFSNYYRLFYFSSKNNHLSIISVKALMTFKCGQSVFQDDNLMLNLSLYRLVEFSPAGFENSEETDPTDYGNIEEIVINWLRNISCEIIIIQCLPICSLWLPEQGLCHSLSQGSL